MFCTQSYLFANHNFICLQTQVADTDEVLDAEALQQLLGGPVSNPEHQPT
jgi:hypothetical protein